MELCRTLIMMYSRPKGEGPTGSIRFRAAKLPRWLTPPHYSHYTRFCNCFADRGKRKSPAGAPTGLLGCVCFDLLCRSSSPPGEQADRTDAEESKGGGFGDRKNVHDTASSAICNPTREKDLVPDGSRCELRTSL
jgi:hypothetical protein